MEASVGRSNRGVLQQAAAGRPGGNLHCHAARVRGGGVYGPRVPVLGQARAAGGNRAALSVRADAGGGDNNVRTDVWHPPRSAPITPPETLLRFKGGV